jgi:hypothetical protein
VRDIDVIIQQLQLSHPEIHAEQLRVAHPGVDDDGLWFFKHPVSGVEVQLESSTGSCPFVVESTGSALRPTAATVQQAVALVLGGFGLGMPAV